ncbi:MAG: c-type cytochrome biogenesis protein CcmI [Ancylobacter novellus]|uniref:C-type cytochrome biogenesis protein CcmI n=1 Tax=Ancylobacter novellus TaxID=921 RepID=A0A2W5KR52_ANCNO|nr:MAG: c-type cytochrome biogenesis protein CcmI [Ancylobacter novellus]
MTGAAVFVVLGSLARSRAGAPDSAEADAAVYRDQIDEIARDRSRGLIDEREAEGARVEVARRLIAASERSAPEPAAAASLARRRVAAAASLVAIPAIALGGYAALGKPNLPDLPLASRQQDAPNGANVADLAARVEQALAKNPNDGRGWAVIAPVYLRLGRAEDAARAYANVIRLLGSTPEREADYGEALFAAAGGMVTAEARGAFDRSVAGERPSVKGSFYLARAAEQDGDLAGAIARLKPVLAQAPEDAPYIDAIKGEFQRIADVPSLPLPNAEEAGDLKTPEAREAFIRRMVDGLDQRLAADGGDLGEWLRLARARAALGEADKARATLAKAREKFGGDGRAAIRIEALGLGLGLEGRGA